MAYLLKDAEEDRARRRRQSLPNAARSPSLFRSVLTALHDLPTPRRGTTVSTAAATATTTYGSTTAIRTRAAATTVTVDSTTAAPTASASAAASSFSATTDHGPSVQHASCAITDDELYESAVDYADIIEVLQAPTCPSSRQGFAPVPSTSTRSTTSSHQPPQSAATTDGPLSFVRIADDPTTGVEVFSSPVRDFPIHMMRATAIMPCSPAEVLQYMDNSVRPHWDGYLRESKIIRELREPRERARSGVGSEAQQQTALSRALHVRGRDGNSAPRDTASGTAATTTTTTSGTTAAAVAHSSTVLGPSPASLASIPPSIATTAAPPFTFAPGQRRVALHYLGVKSPVMFVQDRDFELVVSESVLPDGTAVMKAFTAPRCSGVPLDPSQTRYVRGVVVLSGIFGRPLRLFPSCTASGAAATNATAAAASPPSDELARLPASLQVTAARDLAHPRAAREGVTYCQLEYFGLVHPLGLIPPQIASMVISAQLSAVRRLQSFIADHPLSSLRPSPLPPRVWARGGKRNDPSTHRVEGEFAIGGGHPDKKEGGKTEEQRENLPWWSRARCQLLSRL